MKGWRLGSKIILPTPGHSPCSVSLLWPEKKALFISDTDWVCNPVFIYSSLRDSISTLKMMKELNEASNVDLLLPAHGQVKEGGGEVLAHLDSYIRRLDVIRSGVLSAYLVARSHRNLLRVRDLLKPSSPDLAKLDTFGVTNRIVLEPLRSTRPCATYLL